MEGGKGAEIEGVLCSIERWDPDSGRCKDSEVECAFCKYMRAGPCGDVFTAWETCVERCKAEEKDFFDICAGETLALKECVDANNDYYGFLDEIEKERQAEDAATA
jgi:hypothetical protein